MGARRRASRAGMVRTDAILRYGKAVARIVPIAEERSLEPDPRLCGVSISDADLFDDCSTMFEVMDEK